MKLLIILLTSLGLVSTASAVSTPGLNYSYYEGTWTSLPNFSTLTPATKGITADIDLSVRSRELSYGIVWEGFITIPSAGTYTFETNSDDGSQLFLNNSATPLVNNDGEHAAWPVAGTVTLNAGIYPIRVTFFQSAGGHTMEVYWSSNAGIARQRIPATAFTAGTIETPKVSEPVVSTASLTGVNNYYFSTKNGDDSRTSTQAQNPATPWKTLDKLNSFFPNLKAGDAVLLNKGETYEGKITVSNTGTATLPIIISSYGTGSKPVITGMKTLTQWTAVGTNVYEASLNSNRYLNMVTINDAALAMGRWPNAADPNKGYLTIDQSTKQNDAYGRFSGGTITDAALSGSPNWTGGQAVMRKNHWVIDRCLITSHSGTTFSYSTPSPHEIKNGWGYFIQNSPATLDKQGEWYYNASAKTLRIYSTVNPSTLSVKAAALDTLVYLNNRHYITFDNLSFQGADTVMLQIENNASHIKVQNCDFNYSGMRGIVANSSSYVSVENCTLNNTNNEGIILSDCNYSSVRNTTIRNNCMKAGMGDDNNGGSALSLVHETNGLVEYNTLDSLGCSGIAFIGNNIVIKNNFVNNFTLVKDDAAGIYTWAGGVPGDIMFGRKIIGNIVMNGIGAPEGTESAVGYATNGIYIDDIGQNVEISGNTSASVNSAGLYLHNSQNIQVSNNTFYNNKAAQILLIHDANGFVDSSVNGQMVTKEYVMKNSEINNNILFAKTEAQGVLSQGNNITNSMSFATYDNNYYARPLNPTGGILSTNYTNGAGGTIYANYDLEGWRNQFGWDKLSQVSAVGIAPYKIVNSTGVNKFANGSFSTSASGAEAGNIITWENKIDGGSVKITSSTRTTALAGANMSIGSTVAGTTYLIKFTVLGSTNTENMSAYIRRWGGDYAILSGVKYFKLSTTRTECEFIFTAPTSDPEVKLTLLAAENVTPFWFDNISAMAVTSNVTIPDDSIRFEYNASSIVKTVTLNGTYADVKNNKYTNQVSLAPYTSVVLMKTTDQSVNKAPMADAGADIEMMLPVNAAKLTASKSSGSIQAYSWKKIAGPAQYTLSSTTSINTDLSNLVKGTYSFKLTITDNSGLSSTDTISVNVLAKANMAPVARAGADITVSTLQSYITLSGDASSDADGTIKVYSWTKISGPSKYAFGMASRSNTTFKNLVAGTYLLKLTVTDNTGATGSDTIVVNVNAPSFNSSSASLVTSNAATSFSDAAQTIATPSKDQVVVYPNPVANMVNARFTNNVTGKITLTIFNLNGITVQSADYDKTSVVFEKNLNVTTLRAGVYYLEIKLNNGTSVTKSFIKN